MKDDLGTRMKESYEKVFRYKLPHRMPVIIRLDGKAFHTLTKKLNLRKPFDNDFIEVMNKTALTLCKEIQGVQCAYVQSDEISLLLHNYKKLETQPWFNNEVQKMTSISASTATAKFNFELAHYFLDTSYYCDKDTFGLFDSRVFTLPEKEVCNYFAWRQQDITRNSVQMLARSLFSHKECQCKNNSELQEMIFNKGENWNNLATKYKRGRCIIKNEEGKWVVDEEIPIFTKDRNYINDLLKVKED